MLVAEGVYKRDRYFYLMEVEPQPPTGRRKRLAERKEDEPKTFTLFLCYGNEQSKRLDAGKLRRVLAYCAEHRGAWLRKKELTELGKHKIKHTSKSLDMYIDRIKDHLRDGGLLL